MTEYAFPEAEAFNLLGEKNSNPEEKQNLANRVTHIKSRITLTMMADDVKLPLSNIPTELSNHLKYITILFIQ